MTHCNETENKRLNSSAQKRQFSFFRGESKSPKLVNLEEIWISPVAIVPLTKDKIMEKQIWRFSSKNQALTIISVSVNSLGLNRKSCSPRSTASNATLKWNRDKGLNSSAQSMFKIRRITIPLLERGPRLRSRHHPFKLYLLRMIKTISPRVLFTSLTNAHWLIFIAD